jgi:hypothetical protein
MDLTLAISFMDDDMRNRDASGAWQFIRNYILEGVQIQATNSQSKYAEQICSQCKVVTVCFHRQSNPKLKGCALIYE